MTPTTLERLREVIEQAAADQVVAHQREMQRAFDELQRDWANGAEYHRAYRHGRVEERSDWVARVQQEQVNYSPDSNVWRLLQRLQEAARG